jgi:hypothetical protein
MMHHPGRRLLRGCSRLLPLLATGKWRYYDDIIYDDECSLLVHIYIALAVRRQSVMLLKSFVHRS